MNIRALPLASACAAVICTVFFAAPREVRAQGAAGDTLRACVHKNGQFRVVNQGEACRPNETAITVNVQGPPGPPGPQGEQGERGPEGPQGAQGEPGVSFYQQVEETDVSNTLIFPQTTRHVTVSCQEGRRPLGGGCSSSDARFNVTTTAPTDDGWTCTFRQDSPQPTPPPVTFKAHAICAVVQ